MKQSNTPKIVVGVGLVVAYATGLAVVALRDDPVTSVAQSAVVAPIEQAPFDQVAEEAFPSDAIASASINPLVSAVVQPDVVAPEPVITKARSTESTIVREQPVVSVVPASAAVSTDVEKPVSTSEVASVVDEPANSTVDTPSSGQAESESSGADSEITTDVEAQFASAAPGGSDDSDQLISN